MQESLLQLNRLEGLYIEITQSCNLHCPHCYNRSGDFSNTMAVDQFIKILSSKKLKDNKIKISVSGGEPLCHPKIEQILQYLLENKTDATIITNGTLAQKKLLPYLLKSNGSMKVQVSLDGACEKTNSKIRGEGHFYKVLEFLKAAQRQGYTGSNVRMTLTKYNKDEIKDFFSSLHEI